MRQCLNENFQLVFGHILISVDISPLVVTGKPCASIVLSESNWIDALEIYSNGLLKGFIQTSGTRLTVGLTFISLTRWKCNSCTNPTDSRSWGWLL